MVEKTSIEVGKGLADDDNGEDAAAWVSRVKKSKKKKKKEEEAKKAKEFDDMDEQVVETEVLASGMRVAHDADAIESGREHVLVLKDTSVLDASGKCAEDGDDVLESTDLVESEKREFNKKRAKGFDKYDEEQNDTILAQYDESKQEFEKSRKSFVLDKEGNLDAMQLSAEEQKRLDSMAADKGMTRYSLDDGQKEFTWTTVQRDTFTEAEMAQFKKPKRRVVKKKNKEAAAQKMKELQREVEEEAEPEALRAHRVSNEDEENQALAKLAVREKAMETLNATRETTKKELDNIAVASLTGLKEGTQQEEEEDGKVYIDATTEFIKQIESKIEVTGGPSAGAMDVDDDDEDVEAKTAKEKKRKEFEEKVKSTKLINEVGLGSTASALAFVQEKGLIDTAYIGRENDAVFEADDDGGPVIKRKDQYGRDLTPHEAFRQQSRVFHGKMPSKNRVLKSERRWEELDKMRRMTEKDSLAGLRTAQASTGQAGIVLQGRMQDRLEKVREDVSNTIKRDLENAAAAPAKRQK